MVTWAALGRPAPWGILKRQPATAVLLAAVYLSGMAPAIRWALTGH